MCIACVNRSNGDPPAVAGTFRLSADRTAKVFSVCVCVNMCLLSMPARLSTAQFTSQPIWPAVALGNVCVCVRQALQIERLSVCCPSGEQASV